jgi:hypothetical protein
MGRPVRARLLAGADKESSSPSSARLGVRLRRGGGDKHCVQGSDRGVRKVEFIVEVWFGLKKRQVIDYMLDVMFFVRSILVECFLDGQKMRHTLAAYVLRVQHLQVLDRPRNSADTIPFQRVPRSDIPVPGFT